VTWQDEYDYGIHELVQKLAKIKSKRFNTKKTMDELIETKPNIEKKLEDVETKLRKVHVQLDAYQKLWEALDEDDKSPFEQGAHNLQLKREAFRKEFSELQSQLAGREIDLREHERTLKKQDDCLDAFEEYGRALQERLRELGHESPLE
jgi:chromosome segregation ATPase